MELHDAIVVGAGPAGTTAARILAENGMDALLLEKDAFPRAKPCAGWISPLVLDLTGISPGEYGENGTMVPFSSLVVWDSKDVPREVAFERVMGYGIVRSQFDSALASNIGGAKLKEKTRITSVERDGDGVVLNGSFKAPIVVGAGGHFCPVAGALGGVKIDNGAVYAVVSEGEIGSDIIGRLTPYPNTPEIIFNDDFSGYGWYFQKGNYLNIGVGSTSAKDLNHHKERLLRLLGAAGRLPDPKDIPLPKFYGHAYRLGRLTTGPGVSDGAILVGDALGVAYNMSGEGIGPAIFSGAVAADAILKAGGDYSAKRLSAYTDEIRSRFGRPYPAPILSILSLIPRGAIRLLRGIAVGSDLCRREVVAKRWFFRD